MRLLQPAPGDRPALDLVEAYTPPAARPDRPFLRCNMIASLDGAISIGGRSGPLGGPADRRVFEVLRSWADVVLVGAGTMRTEAYGPARLHDELRRRRTDRGQSAVPPIAVVTRTAELDWSLPFFTGAEVRPIVITTADSGGSARRRGADVADVVVAGDGSVDPRLALERLQERGYRSVLLEGGPGLNGDFLRQDLMDELCLTVSPCLVGGEGPRLLAGPELPRPLDLQVLHLVEDEGFFFYRLSVRRL